MPQRFRTATALLSGPRTGLQTAAVAREGNFAGIAENGFSRKLIWISPANFPRIPETPIVNGVELLVLLT